MKTQKKAEEFNLDHWVLESQIKKCKICRCEPAQNLIVQVLEAAARHKVTVPTQKIVQLLEERGIIRTTDHTVRDHIRRCNVKTKAQ